MFATKLAGTVEGRGNGRASGHDWVATVDTPLSEALTVALVVSQIAAKWGEWEAGALGIEVGERAAGGSGHSVCPVALVSLVISVSMLD